MVIKGIGKVIHETGKGLTVWERRKSQNMKKSETAAVFEKETPPSGQGGVLELIVH